MADSQQGVRHQSARDAAGTVDTYDGDLRALFESVATVPAGSTYNEAFMLWLQSVTGSSADNINDLAALYASQQTDTYNWSSLGDLGLPTIFKWTPEVGEAFPTGTFARPSSSFYYDGTKYVVANAGVIRDAAFADPPNIGQKGYLSELAATNRILFSNDMTNAAWTAAGAATPTDLGVEDIGVQATRISGLGALGVDDISQSAAGFTASGSVAPSVLLRRNSTTGTLRIVNADGGAVNGEWQVDLSLIGTGWVRLQPGSVFAGFSEVTPWVADGGGNAGLTYHAAAGGPLTVDLTLNQVEDTAFATSPIGTFGAAFTRAGDTLDTGLIWPANGWSALVDVTGPLISDPTSGVDAALGEVGTAEVPIYQGAALIRSFINGIALVSTGDWRSTRLKVAVSNPDTVGGTFFLSVTGVPTVSDVTTSNSAGNIGIGYRQTGNQFRGLIHSVTIYSVTQTQAELEALVA